MENNSEMNFGYYDLMQNQVSAQSDASFNRYGLVQGVARRARMLYAGGKPLVESGSLKQSRIAENEIRAGKVSFTIVSR
ncbi:MAG: DNA-directed RNA polymerase subunit omega [Janthinobacterium lividum]